MYLCTRQNGKIIKQNEHFKLWPTFYVATNETLVETLHNTVLISLKDCMLLQLKRTRTLNDSKFSLLV